MHCISSTAVLIHSVIERKEEKKPLVNRQGNVKLYARCRCSSLFTFSVQRLWERSSLVVLGEKCIVWFCGQTKKSGGGKVTKLSQKFWVLAFFSLEGRKELGVGRGKKAVKNEKLTCLVATVPTILYNSWWEHILFQVRMNIVCLWDQMTEVTCSKTTRHDFPFQKNLCSMELYLN